MEIFYNINSISDTSEGIKEIVNPTKTLKAMLVPRSFLSDFNKLPEANQAGVYLLYSVFDGSKVIYIGQTGFNISSRLNEHNRNKQFWTMALVFVEKADLLNMNSTHTKLIESMLCERAEKAKVSKLDNIVASNPPRIQDSDRYAAETWTNEAVNITKLIGLPFFVESLKKESKIKDNKINKDIDKVKEIEIDGKIQQVSSWAGVLRVLLEYAVSIKGKDFENMESLQKYKRISRDKENFRISNNKYLNIYQLSNGVYANMNYSKDMIIKELEEISNELNIGISIN